MIPVRIHLSRKKGFRLPPNTVNVSRPGMWGNPFIVGEPSGVFPEGMGFQGKAETMIESLTLTQAIDFYRALLNGFLSPEMYPKGHEWVRNFKKRNGGHPGEVVRKLRGLNVACWCEVNAECHGDVILELANK